MPDLLQPQVLHLTRNRRRTSEFVRPEQPFLDHAESDRARVIFSSAFRHLQDKAQVFSLEEDVAIRNRLSHSLEVAHVGRNIAQLACRILADKKGAGFKRLNAELQSAISQTVDTACLIHDIGNPPFGHFGEIAIKTWFTNKYELFQSLFKGHEAEFTSRYEDFKQFDGNAQGFRILTSLQRNHDHYSLNLTYTLLASTVKYPGTPAKKLKKPSIFHTEEDIFKTVWKECGLTEGRRHPLSYLMEAADDIAYCLSDIEDAVNKGVCSHQDVENFLSLEAYSESKRIAACWDRACVSVRDAAALRPAPLAKYVIFRATFMLGLIESVAQEFADRIIKGDDKWKRSLVDSEPDVAEALRIIKRFAVEKIYTTRVVYDNELAGSVIIDGILDAFESILTMKRKVFTSIINKEDSHYLNAVDRALVSLLPQQGREMYLYFVQNLSESDQNRGVHEWMLRAHLVVDFVSGMTDHYALKTYQKVAAP